MPVSRPVFAIFSQKACRCLTSYSPLLSGRILVGRAEKNQLVRVSVHDCACWHCVCVRCLSTGMKLCCPSALYIAGATKRPTWRVTLDPIEAGGPYVISAESRGCNITLSDVLFGDVWLCSGQSNMDFYLSWVSTLPFTYYRLQTNIVSNANLE